MSSFSLPVSGLQITLREGLTHKVARALDNFEANHMRWVESTKEVDADGKSVREVIYPGSLLSEKQDLMILSFVEKIINKDQELTVNQDAIDNLDHKDGAFLLQKVLEAYEALKKK